VVGGMWQGLYPPQSIFGRRRFRRVLLDPPNFNPGSWCGAGKLWIDVGGGEYWLTSRPREGGLRRGYAVDIYRSGNGEDFRSAASITKEELSGICGKEIHSIEGQQLLRDPLTGLYHLYLSVDTAKANVAGVTDKVYESRWETYLMTAEDPNGPWKGGGFALVGDADYDDGEARDATIDIVDGRYFALYKARRAGTGIVHMALALSSDGRRWCKLGEVTVDGGPQRDFFLLSGSILSGCTGPIFVGTKTTEVIKGAALTKHFAAYAMEHRRLNLETIFEASWIPDSRYEHEVYPIHTYASLAYDSIRNRWLTSIEAVDPTFSKEPGLNSEVDRLLLYVTDPI